MDLWRSPGPTSLLKQSHLEPVASTLYMPPFVFEFGQEVLVHPSQPPGIFVWHGICWNRTPLSFTGLSLPPRPYLIWLFWADLWRCQSLFSWSPGLWTCFSFSFLHWESWTPVSSDHHSQVCLWLSHSQQSCHCWCMWGPAEHSPCRLLYCLEGEVIHSMILLYCLCLLHHPYNR